MAIRFLIAITILVAMVSNTIPSADAQLYNGFYDRICPRAIPLVKEIVGKAIYSDRRMGASLLRLHFHDCFVDGCDASVLLDGANTEKDALPNKNSIRGFEVIDRIKSALNDACGNVVSCADILAVAARDSIAFLGGPFYRVQLGRRDKAAAPDASRTSSLPSPFADRSNLLGKFQAQGLGLKDLVVLSGAHSIGFATCGVAKSRVQSGTNIDQQFSSSIQQQCQAPSWVDTVLLRLDDTPYRFDNGYYQNLIRRRGLLTSDQELFKGDGSESDRFVRLYSQNKEAFFRDFAESMLRMGNIGVLSGNQGDIRRNCRVLNYHSNY